MPVSNMESFSDLLSEKTEGRGQLAEQHPLSNDGGSSDSALLPEDPQHELPEKKMEDIIRWDSCNIQSGRISLCGAYITEDLSTSVKTYAESFPETEEHLLNSRLYIAELSPYESDINEQNIITSVGLSEIPEFSFEYSTDRLYNRFEACLWDGTEYISVSEPVYITNPEAAAANRLPFKTPLSKKGLLIELSQVSDAFDLGVCNVIINIPFDNLFGEGIRYTFEGEEYSFDKNVIAAYDKTVSTFSNKSMSVTAVLLNRFDKRTPWLYYPDAPSGGGILYHQFNINSEEGFKHVRAAAAFLSQRYGGSDSDRGRIQNWIIGNEINNQYWNYSSPMDIASYAAEYEQVFRVFYTAIRSQQANARVYFSLDNNWNQSNDNRLRYTSRDTLSAVAEAVSKHGNIDWGLAYHPYSVPTVEPEFWDDFETGQVDMTVDSGVVNFANLSVLTDYMQRPEMLDTTGNVRHIILSEQGFTSKSDSRGNVEKLQAAAFAYAYYIADSNKYIDAFILSRQIDAPSEVKTGLELGIWTTVSDSDINIVPGRRKYIWQVFQNIDRQKTTLEYTDFAREIIGINAWSDVIPEFRWRTQQRKRE
ncbi:MAG: DUF5722 domain-containing protein [Eubacteriales bacterium]|nr:DUF5722 domain-containing protein [Eubacteriales bacterium]